MADVWVKNFLLKGDLDNVDIQFDFGQLVAMEYHSQGF